MATQLISRLFTSCHHQFSWPRRDESGDYYQLCVNCGSRYQYDWETMQRVALIDEDDAVVSDVASKKSVRSERPAWKPRERRLQHHVSVLIRQGGTDRWIGGVSVNVSRSGVLLHSCVHIPQGTAVELVLDLPKEITGEDSSRVICVGSVVRVSSSKVKKRFVHKIACKIDNYEFVPPVEQ